MKKYFLIAMCFLFTMTYSKQFLTVEDVRAEYELIQKDMPKYEKVTVTDDNNSTEGGTVVYHYENKRLKVIVGDYFGETGKGRYPVTEALCRATASAGRDIQAHFRALRPAYPGAYGQ